jgi:hypothetical protein
MNIDQGYQGLDQENDDGSYLTSSMTARSWSREDWMVRRKMVADIWERKNELERKKLLAVLMAHASEATSTQ